MRYWWVYHEETYSEEIPGGYIWSPKRRKNGARNQYYENMREVSPGDIVFSFRSKLITAVGIARSFCYDAAKPPEYATPSSKAWSEFGWRVDVGFSELAQPLRPKDHIDSIRPLLPDKYSPLQQNGDGLQGIYLAALSSDLGKLLLSLLTQSGNAVPTSELKSDPLVRHDEISKQQDDAAELALENSPIVETEKVQLVKARRGQGLFRERVLAIEKACRLSGVCNPQFLIASHIKPWRACDNAERLDGYNGLMLSPNVDFLFDHGFISFADDGTFLISPVADKEAVACLISISPPNNVGTFTAKQREYLSFHRANIFLEAGRTG